MKAARTVAVAMLAFLGVTAIIGATPMLLTPYGEPWHLPQSFLRYSGFSSFLIPRIILLLANGLLSMWVLARVVMRRGRYGWLTVAQGCVLLGWLTVEVAMLRFAAWPHYFYGAVVLVMIATGLVMRGEGEVRQVGDQEIACALRIKFL